VCGAFGTFAHQAYTACLRGQLSSNVRPAGEQCQLPSSRLAARGSPLPLVPSLVRHLWSSPFSATLRPCRSFARHQRKLLRRDGPVARHLSVLPAHRAQNLNQSPAALRLGLPGALRPSGWPNRSLKLTRYGMRCKPGLLPLRHHRSPGLQRTPTGSLAPTLGSHEYAALATSATASHPARLQLRPA
jgi:hypothetical protein